MSESEDDRPQSQRSCGKILLRLLFSHVGLFLLVCLYAAFGAWIFVFIEYDDETQLRKERMIRSIDVNDSLVYLAALFYYWRDKGYSREEWNDKVYSELKTLDKFIVNMVRAVQYDGTMDEESWDREWAFGNSLLFSVTILTTIGYGHVAPNTQLGKICTILYALVGIPLTLIFLANIGELMASVFRYTYSRLCCRWCRGARRQNEYDREAAVRMGGRLPPLSSDDVGKEDYMPTDKAQIPIILNLLLISIFILLGAGIFAYLENWDLLSSGYFTFITLTTIGFGDYYPGNAFEGYKGSISKTLTLMGTCFYMMLGMALVSMCINLMQQQITEKVKWVAMEVGLIQQSDIPDTEEEKPLTTLSSQLEQV
ncbi:TWiK family of potassium channels protein 7-like [Uloborus diversus]|uniref:TWiK family of potassium channels protein 7-like n=1 Tax=Uloborus diversus TaxID=327109 RepID=UPI00240A5EEB|nr:TWiK family of potassium channels protein 7-like [Uloborus diversus]